MKTLSFAKSAAVKIVKRLKLPAQLVAAFITVTEKAKQIPDALDYVAGICRMLV